MKRILSITLAMLIVLSCMTVMLSCDTSGSIDSVINMETSSVSTNTGDNGNIGSQAPDTDNTLGNTDGTTGGPKEDISDGEDDGSDDSAEPSIPDDLDYNGRQVNILINESDSDHSQKYEWYVEDLSGDTLDQAVYMRNAKIEERLNVFLQFTEESHSNMLVLIRESVMTGNNEFDIASGYSDIVTVTAIEGFHKDLLDPDLAYLNLENPYWNQSFIEAATVFDKLYLAVGDMNLSSYMGAHLMMFNEQMLTELTNVTKSDLYSMVSNGDWTWDKMQSLCTEIYNDTTGNESRYALISKNYAEFDGFTAAFDIDLTSTDEDGSKAFMDQTNVENLRSAADMLTKFYKSDKVFFIEPTAVSTPIDCFKEGTSLFYISTLSDIQHLSDMEESYGILPLPKFGEMQKEYYTNTTLYHNTVAVLYNNAQDFEMIGAVLELFAYESSLSLLPTYLQLTVERNIRDTGSLQMLNTIIDSIRWDLADIYYSTLGKIRTTIWSDALIKAINSTDGDGSAEVDAKISEHGNKLSAYIKEFNSIMSSNS